MITTNKKEQLARNIADAIYNNSIMLPYGFDRVGSPVMMELKNNIEFFVKSTVDAAFQQLINDLYTQEQFESDIGLK